MQSRRTLLKSAALGLTAPFINEAVSASSRKTRLQQSIPALTLDLVRRSTVIDMLGLLTLNYRKLLGWEAQPGLFGAADFEKLKDSGITIFHPAVGFTEGDVYASSLRDITGLNEFIGAHQDRFLRVDCPADFERAKHSGQDRNPDRPAEFEAFSHRRGCRQLLWPGPARFATYLRT